MSDGIDLKTVLMKKDLKFVFKSKDGKEGISLSY